MDKRAIVEADGKCFVVPKISFIGPVEKDKYATRGENGWKFFIALQGDGDDDLWPITAESQEKAESLRAIFVEAVEQFYR